MRNEHTSRRPGGESYRGRGERMRAASPACPGWRLAPPPPLRTPAQSRRSTSVRCTARGRGWLAVLLSAAPHQVGGSGDARPGSLLPASNCIARPSPSLPLAARARPGVASRGALVPRALQPALRPPRGAGSRAVAPRLAESWVQRPALRPLLRVPTPQRGAVLPRPARPGPAVR